MAIQTRTLIPQTKSDDPNNGWEQLRLQLDPIVINAPRIQEAGARLPRRLGNWLARSVSRFPWLNQLALAAVIYNESGAVQPIDPILGIHSFLRWAIPARYPDVSSLKLDEALVAYFGDPPQRRGQRACNGFNAVQLHMHAYLQSLPAETRTALAPFLLPILMDTPRLARLRANSLHESQNRRKEQAFAVVRDLHALVAMGRRRYQWLADLEAQVQHVVELAKNHAITLPAIIRCPDLDHRQDLTFRVWDRLTWIKNHLQDYHGTTLKKTSHRNWFFLQLVGTLPDTPWFLRAAELGALNRVHELSGPARQYLRDYNISLFQLPGGIVYPNQGQGSSLRHALAIAAGTPEDSRVLFCIEPLLVGAAICLFVLVCLTQSGMRIGELQQVTGDKTCMKIGIFPTFDEPSEPLSENSTKRFFWLLYPKGSTERQPYAVTPLMQEALTMWMQVHQRFCGRFQEVAPDRVYFTHARRFRGKHRFVLQWNGKQLLPRELEACLGFLLLEHLCLDSHGQPVHMTAHILRHGVAGYLRQQGVALEDIAALLHQVNVVITNYYSKPSPQDLFAQVGPFLTRLGEVAEIDPTTLRTVGDIQRLGQEALKRFGVLRRIPGGTCAVFTSCEVQFKCASCPAYIPDQTRREEVREKIVSCARTAQFLNQSGDFLQAEVQRAHGRQWERVEKEMQALAAIELTAPPFESALKEFGMDHLDEVDDEWMLTLKQQPRLTPGGNLFHG